VCDNGCTLLTTWDRQRRTDIQIITIPSAPLYRGAQHKLSVGTNKHEEVNVENCKKNGIRKIEMCRVIYSQLRNYIQYNKAVVITNYITSVKSTTMKLVLLPSGTNVAVTVTYLLCGDYESLDWLLDLIAFIDLLECIVLHVLLVMC